MNDEELDALILDAANEHWTKIAVIISKVYDAYEEAGHHELTESLAQDIAQRLYILVDNGRLDVQGNMRRWRDADVRLIKP
jgi:hypothetical protein